MSLTAKVTSQISARFLGGAAGAGQVEQALDNTKTTQFLNGTGAGQANRLFASQRTVASGATMTFDLAGSLLDAFGNTITFTAVKALRLQSRAANTTSLTLRRPVSNGWGGFIDVAGSGIIIPPGGSLLLERGDAAGWPVTAGTGDLFDVVNGSGASAIFDIQIIGIGA